MEFLDLIKYLASRSAFIVMPFSLCTLAILLLDKLAPTYHLVDRPSTRKFHDGEIPIVGGLAIYLSFAISVSILLLSTPYAVLLILGFCMVLLGLLDDLLDLNPFTRLLIQATACVFMALFADVRINALGSFFGGEGLQLSLEMAVLFTIVCTIGVINSINMLDGLDGLAGSVLLVTLFGLALVALINEEYWTLKLISVLISCIVAFLCFNSRVFVKKAMIFMGDAGTLFLGITLCWLFITMSQDNMPEVGQQAILSTIAAGWLFGLPLADTVVVMVRRTAAGRSPFHAGRDHFHHSLLETGMSVGNTVLAMVAIQSLFVVFGLIVNANTVLEPYAFWLFVGVVLLHYFLTPRVINVLGRKDSRQKQYG